jgi:tRNA(Ile)-lysidine synthase
VGRPALIRKLAAALAGDGAPPAGTHCLVAVSGGPDSTALLAGLVELAPAHGLRLTAAHVAHGLRGAESDADRARAAAHAARAGVPFLARAAAVAPGEGVEAGARRVRYRALAALARAAGASVVATGHTRDDQVETMLLRLLRGAGRRGLAGMAVRRGRLWRPLLAVTRTDVRRFLADRALDFAVDRTNADLRFTRNRVRRLLVPFLEAEFNPRLGAALAGLAARLRDEETLLATLAATRAAALVHDGALDVAVDAEPPALARRIVHAWLERGAARGVAATHVERVLALARGAERGVVAVPGPARVLREGERLVRRAGREPAATPFAAPIAPGGQVDGPGGGWSLRLSGPRPRRPDEVRPADAAVALFDAEALPAPLVVRSPAVGDRIRLLGGGTRKVQDVLVDAKVPREARAMLPVLAAGPRILWVAGVARGAGAALGPSTTSVVEGRLERHR